MNILVVGIIIFINIFIIAYLDCKTFDKFDRIFVSIFISTLLTLMSIVIIFAGCSLLTHYEIGSKDYTRSYEISIHSLKDSQHVSGSFVLGSGRVNTTDLYHFYRKNNEGMFYRESVPVNETLIQEGNENPKLLVYEKYQKGPLIKFMMVFSDENVDCNGYRYILKVPSGTVIQTFEVR